MKVKREILFVSSNFPPVVGGSSVVYDQLCRNASQHVVALGAARNYQTHEAWSDLASQDRQRGYIIHRLSFLRPPLTRQERLSWSGRLAKLILGDVPLMARVIGYIFILILRYRVKVICLGELIYGGWLVFPLRYVLRRKVLIYTHGEEISQDGDSLLGRARGLFLRHANGIIAVSQFCKGQIVAKFGIDPTRIKIVSNGVDLAAFCRGDPDRFCLPAGVRDKRIILSVSRLVERKGHEYLIRALPQIVSIVPKAHCIIVGDGLLAGKLRDIVSDMGMVAHCTILGSVPHQTLIQLYRNCEVFALPCRTLPDGDTEGFGLVFLEANACGKPVVAGAAGGTIEAVMDGETGLLVDGSDPADIAHAVLHLLNEPELARKLAETGWRRAQGRDWMLAAKEFLGACRSGSRVATQPSYQSRPNALAPPPGENSVALPPSLLVTVDVEEEFNWRSFARGQYTVRGAEALRSFHQDCRSVGVEPVYLLTYPILVDPIYRRVLTEIAADGGAELGIHLHSWTAPPFWEEPNIFTSYQCNLPEHIERRKLEILCQTFEACFGRPATIHRAGRWGGSDRTAALLEDLGVTVDLSPSARFADVSSGGPDFTNLGGAPFWSGPHGQVLTIPASAINYLRGPRWLSTMMFGLTRSVPFLAGRYGKPLRLSPESGDENLLLALSCELHLRRLPIAVYTVHNTSVYDGGNPYSAGFGAASDLRHRSLKFLSAAINAKLLKPATCAQILDQAKRLRAKT